MTMDLFAVQEDVREYAEDNLGLPVIDTEIPSVDNEPTHNSVPTSYVVVRFSDAWETGRGAVAGPLYGEMYTIIDFLVVSPDPTESRELAYGSSGVAKKLTGVKPSPDGGVLKRYRGTRSFVVGDGTQARPKRFISTVSFRLPVNMIIED